MNDEKVSVKPDDSTLNPGGGINIFTFLQIEHCTLQRVSILNEILIYRIGNWYTVQVRFRIETRSHSGTFHIM